jgi:hypothetical protein
VITAAEAIPSFVGPDLIRASAFLEARRWKEAPPRIKSGVT